MFTHVLTCTKFCTHIHYVYIHPGVTVKLPYTHNYFTSLLSAHEDVHFYDTVHLSPVGFIPFKKWGAGGELMKHIEKHSSLLSVHNTAKAAMTSNPDKYCNYQFCLSQLTRLPILCHIHHAYTSTCKHAYKHPRALPHMQTVLICQIHIHHSLCDPVKVRFSEAPFQGNWTVGESILNCCWSGPDCVRPVEPFICTNALSAFIHFMNWGGLERGQGSGKEERRKRKMRGNAEGGEEVEGGWWLRRRQTGADFNRGKKEKREKW